jgi:hypothetical protein
MPLAVQLCRQVLLTSPGAGSAVTRMAECIRRSSPGPPGPARSATRAVSLKALQLTPGEPPECTDWPAHAAVVDQLVVQPWYVLPTLPGRLVGAANTVAVRAQPSWAYHTFLDS